MSFILSNTSWPNPTKTMPGFWSDFFAFTHSKIQHLELGIGKGLQPSNELEFHSFVVWSSYWHLVASWDYVLSSWKSFEMGAIAQGIHLAYYAEMRAMASCLSSRGLLTRQNDFYYFDTEKSALQNLNIKSVTGTNESGSHEIKWSLFETILKEETTEIMGSSCKFQNISLASLGNGIFSSQVTPEMLSVSNVVNAAKLELFAKDRSLRNIVSYRPFRNISDFCEGFENSDIKAALKGFILNASTSGPISRYIICDFLNSLALKAMINEEPKFDGKIEHSFTKMKLIEAFGDSQPELWDELFSFSDAEKNLLLSASDMSLSTHSKNKYIGSLLTRSLFLVEISSIFFDKMISVYPKAHQELWRTFIKYKESKISKYNLSSQEYPSNLFAEISDGNFQDDFLEFYGLNRIIDETLLIVP